MPSNHHNRVRQFILYFSSAFTAMIVNVASRVALSHLMPFGVSIVLSYFAGHIINYLMSALLVFKAKQGGRSNLSWRTFARFTLVACGGLAVMFTVSMTARAVLARLQLPFSKELLDFAAHICGIGCSFIANYVGHILYSFRNKGGEK